MSDEIEKLNQTTPPRLSDAAIQDYRRLLNDKKFQDEHPNQYEMLKASVENALRATGQDKPPPGDGRSPAQALHDARFGVTFSNDRPQLPEHLAAVIARDAAAAEVPDKTALEQHLGRAGFDYEKTVAAAQSALDRAGSGHIKADRLSAHSVVQLATLNAHLNRWSASRPKMGG